MNDELEKHYFDHDGNKYAAQVHPKSTDKMSWYDVFVWDAKPDKWHKVGRVSSEIAPNHDDKKLELVEQIVKDLSL